MALFYKKAAIATMIKHGRGVQSKATEFLNQGNIPVCDYDDPLYALAKFVPWNFPQTHGEDTYIAMFGGLHMDMAIRKHTMTTRGALDGQMHGRRQTCIFRHS